MKDKRVKEDRLKAIVPEVVDGGTYAELVGAIGGLLERARERIANTANTALVETYWNTGRYIVEYEQHGSDRAKYGSRLLSTLARDLTLKHGSGFNRNNLQYMRKLYRAFPICTTLSCKLSWSHYLEILKCSDELEIGFYVAECARSNWNVRELRRQMKSSLFERLALSKDKKGVPRKQAGWIKTWIEIHCDELAAAWEMLRRGVNPPEIAPLSR